MRLCLESRRRSRRSPPPAKTWVTCWRKGDPARGPQSTFHEIYGPVGLLDGGVELAPLAGQLVHPAPQGSYLDGGQDTDLRPPVARKPVGKLAKALGVGPQELWNLRPEDITDRGEESTKQAS